VDNSHDKSFFSSFLLVLGGLLAFTFAIVFIAGMLGGGTDSDAKVSAKLLDERTAPVATVITDPALLVKVSAPAAAHASLSGEQIVAQTCSACHGAGMLGAPKIGDKGAWGARKSAAGGLDGLLKNAIAGKNAMPPRGGNADLSDGEVKSAIQFMLGKAGI
jgi:cytochrome c5